MIQEIIDGLLGWVMNFVLNLLMNFIIKPIFTLAYHLVIAIVTYYFYQVSVVFLSVIDLISDLFRMMAGLAPGLTFTGLTNFFAPGTIASDDMLIQFVTSTEVIGMFGSMFVVGLFLTLMSTMVATIKQEFNLQKANKKGEVLGKLFRALFNMLFVPVVCIFGMYMGNLFLKVVDAATGGDDATISGRIFTAAARGAFYGGVDRFKVSLSDPSTCAVTGSINAVINLMFEAINELFGEDNPEQGSSVGSGLNESILDQYIYVDKHDEEPHRYRVYYNSEAVSWDFNATKINYILIYFSSVAVIKCMLQASFGLVSRLYKGVALFIIMPGIIGISPMDEGTAFKSWKKEITKQIIGAYGVIIAVNLYLELMGIFSNISVNYVPTNAPNAGGSVSLSGLTTSTLALLITDNGFATAILQIVFIVCGALMLDKFSATISSLIGAENLASVGKGLFGDTSKATSGAVKTTTKIGAAGLALSYKAANGLIKGPGALAEKMQSKSAGRQALRDSFIKGKLGTREEFIANMMSQKHRGTGKGHRKPKTEKERKQMEARYSKLYDEKVAALQPDADQFVKQREDFEKSVRREAKKRTGLFAGGSRSFALREVVDNAMKEYDSADIGKKPKQLSDLGSAQDSKAVALMDNAEGKAQDERKATMKVGVKLGTNALKSLLPGAKMFDEVKSGIAGKRSELRNFSDTDQSIIENFEKALQEGAEEKAKQDYKSLTKTAEQEIFGPLLDNVYNGLENSKSLLKQQYKNLADRAKAYMSQGIPCDELIEQFIEANKLSIINTKGKALDQIMSEIEADIEIKYNMGEVQKKIEAIKGLSNNKQVIAEIKKMIAQYSGAPLIVKELEKTLAQIKSGMSSK